MNVYIENNLVVCTSLRRNRAEARNSTKQFI
jgi:hypothetical protein